MESGLKQMTFKIAELQQTAEVARRESSDDSSSHTPTTSRLSSEGVELLSIRPRQSQEVLIGPTPSTHQTTAAQTDDDSVIQQDLPFGYRISYDPTTTTSHDNDITTTTTTAAEPTLLHQPLLPSPTTLSPQLPYTYSFREITFAHQLERACLERGIYVLANVHLEPAAYRRAFRISRHFASRELMLHRLKKWVQQPVIRPYGDLRLNLGGAGLHYASPSSGSSSSSSSSNGGGEGEQRSRHLTTLHVEEYRYSARARLVAMGLPITAEVEADLRFYEGVWFDMRDVEAYLAELGIRVEPYATLVQAKAETLQGLWQDVGGWGQGLRGNVGKMLDRFPGGSNASQPERRLGASDGSVGFLGATTDANVPMTDELSTEEWERFLNSTVPWLSDVVLGDAPANSAGDGRDISKMLGERVEIDVQRLANGMATSPPSTIWV
ncbi:Bzip family transcription factor [Lasiodiplodia theobromae]|uniref:Bzip family transcription factor n=1 Tax=Lasiodiplodia theobromae TaxID=45133 RepID=UPI0015C3B6B5|nr:Bzip family transcription factor [Lasiodiplodia theobromae]KAF4534440.1 Bzip family transcription factor [Lasiodiplodia theobromae]